jgi:murein L,D-transpeptidase YafK
MIKRIALAASLTLALAACQGDTRSTRHLVPIPPATMALMASKGMSQNDPILMRAYKKESEIEVWKRGSDGRYALLKTYPMCRWSGQLGPKTREGDRQAPEGFYTVAPAQMNPNSSFHLSFDLGYPNAYDRAHGRTGAHLMVHGSCSSSGCFAMTDEAISEVYALARESFASGQRSFQFQSYPFRMTAENLAKHRLDPNIAFWKNLKEGNDTFEVTHEEPQVGVGNGRYVFDAGNPSVAAAVAQKQQRDEQQVTALVARGVQPVRLVYADGGQNRAFREALAAGEDGSLAVDASARNRLGDVSRPEALAAGPREILLNANGSPRQGSPANASYASQRAYQ